jgi:hypothetical protein
MPRLRIPGETSFVTFLLESDVCTVTVNIRSETRSKLNVYVWFELTTMYLVAGCSEH